MAGIPEGYAISRSFLLLQGGASPFFRQLGLALQNAGHRVHRINFCPGDALFWGGAAASDFGDALDRLPSFLEEKFRGNAVTDIVAFGDCRPWHRIAIEAARAAKARVHVFEEGYLRPGWITLERDGVNGFSRLPRDGGYYRDAARRLPPAAAPHPAAENLLLRAGYDIAYHVSNFLFAGRFPGYRNWRQESAPMEYLGWAARFASWPLRYPSYRAVMRRLAQARIRYFLFPLQLSGDTQIQVHSPFQSMSEAIEHVLGSFARHAPPGTSLVLKLHPLDTGWASHDRQIARLAAKLGIAARALYVDGGDLEAMIRNACGVVTVNSTVGMAALRAGQPLFAIGEAVYKIPGLTFEGPLEQFWTSPAKPDAALAKDFAKVLVHHTQIRGNYYSRDGIAGAIEGALERLAA